MTARRKQTLTAGYVVLIAAAVAAVSWPTTASAQPDCAPAGELVAPVPWSQQMLAPERVWPFSRGGDITVAVLASGVDADHPQLAGRVATGFDAVAGSGPADDDCLGLGTQVAGVIAADKLPEVGFVGLAPEAQVLPVRVVDAASGSSGAIAETAVLAEGIRWASPRSQVIVVAVPAYEDDPDLAAAVAEAADRGVLVVAAVGDLGGDQDGNPPPYPASYDGVLGVGAVDAAVTRWPGSAAGAFVDLVAPGAEVLTLQRGEGMVPVSGTAVAAGFVAGAAALVLAAGEVRTPAEISRQLVNTTTPAPGGPVSAEYGRGLLNPYAALHERLVTTSPAAMPGLIRPPVDEQSEWIRSRQVATVGSLAALAVIAVVIIGSVALPRGRRRRWRPAVAAPPAQRREPEEPGPPLQLFDER